MFFKKDLDLFAQELIFDEIIKHADFIIERSGLNQNEFQDALSRIKTKLVIVNESQFKFNHDNAIKICPDQEDIEYFALALYLDLPLWSNDKLLKTQDIVKVYSTEELIKILE